MPLLTVHHQTTYRYRHPVSFGEHRMMFRPRDAYDQRLVAHRLVILPKPSLLRWTQDVFGNAVTLARFTDRGATLQFGNTLHVDHLEVTPSTEMLHEHARCFPFSYDADEMPDLLRSIERQMPDPGHVVDRWSRSFMNERRPTGTLELLSAMTREIRRRFTYRARHEPGIQDPRTTLRLEVGTCRDFALLMMEAVRSLGLAARFVTGYLHVPDRKPPDLLRGPDLPRRAGEAERQGGGNTHAWLQVYLPGVGWVDFDPTNGIVGSRGLVRVAVVRDPSMAIPLSGSWTGAAGDCLGMDVSVHVVEAADAAEFAS